MTTYPKAGDLQRGMSSSLTANPKKAEARAAYAQAKRNPANREGGPDDVGFDDPDGMDETNHEGLTWDEWYRAANHFHWQDRPRPGTAAFSKQRRMWKQGVDPTEVAADPHENPSPPGPLHRFSAEEAILEGMARALWVTSYADWVEQQGPTAQKKLGARGGQDWSDVAPETPADALEAARDLYLAISRANNESPVDLLGTAARADGVKATRAYADSFGHCLAMQALGHGVSWFDDHKQFPLKFPKYFEAHCDDGMTLHWEPRIRARQNPGARGAGKPWFRVYELDGRNRYQIGFYKDFASAKAEADQPSGGYSREVVDAAGNVMHRSKR